MHVYNGIVNLLSDLYKVDGERIYFEKQEASLKNDLEMKI